MKISLSDFPIFMMWLRFIGGVNYAQIWPVVSCIIEVHVSKHVCTPLITDLVIIFYSVMTEQEMG